MRWLLVLAVAACGNDKGLPTNVNETDPEARALFPDLDHLYAGDHGLYRGCGPNGGVCHNGNEFPNLDSVGAIVDNIGRDCNQKRDKADTLHDMCERRGDVVLINITGGTQPIEIGYIVPVANSGDPPRTWKLKLRAKPTSFTGFQPMEIRRDGMMIGRMVDISQTRTLDATDPTGRTITMTLPPDPGGGMFDYGKYIAEHLARAGAPGASDVFRVGDPNQNELYGADLEARFIKPGDPQRSYLLRRLFDPTAGPLMPRANCCFWTKPALRALWCWVAGLDATGSNAYMPINYDNCPASPGVLLDYPDPGPECEVSGLCPVVAVGGTGEPTFPSIYTEILVPKCGGDGCHDRAPVSAEIDMRDEDTAYQSLAPRVQALAVKIDPAACQAPCKTMPLDRPTLPPEDIARIKAWIDAGAARE